MAPVGVWGPIGHGGGRVTSLWAPPMLTWPAPCGLSADNGHEADMNGRHTLMAAAVLAGCATAEAPRELPRERVTAETAYAPQIAQTQAAGREIVRQYRARLTGDAERPSAAARRAVKAALAEDTLRCADDYAALPIEGDALGGPGEGLVAVYLVPLPDDADAVPIGGFHRVTVEAGSGEVLHRAAMTASCLDLSLDPGDPSAGDVVRSLLVTHDLTPYPLENHVFASMTSAVDLVVITPGTTWRVAQGGVRALD